VVAVGDLLHDAYGGGEQPSIPAPRRQDDDNDGIGSFADRVRTWSVTREAVAACSALVLAVPAIGRRRAAPARHG
jgi:hypothetical protein